jgi:hypothetical protein
MNARRVPFEAPKERSKVCFGGFRPTKHVEEPRALARGAPLGSRYSVIEMVVCPFRQLIELLL